MFYCFIDKPKGFNTKALSKEWNELSAKERRTIVRNSRPKHLHTTIESANTEAQRLSELYKTKVLVLQIINEVNPQGHS